MEILIVVAIIGLLAAIAIPAMLRNGERARSNRFIRDIQAASYAFLQYALDHGDYPPDSTPGLMPAGMSDYLGNVKWTQTTVIGGKWDWDKGQFGYAAGVSVYEPDRDAAGMLKIDKIFDDGNLSSGSFRQRANGYIYIIEE